MKINQLLLLFGAITLLFYACNTGKPVDDYQLVWSDEFDYSGLPDAWSFKDGNWPDVGVSKWPYDKPFYLILNVAVGGEWGRIKGIDEEAFPQVLEVDYVRVFQKKNQALD